MSDVIAVLRPHTVLSKPISGSGEWGVRYAAYGLPGYALVLEGGCWLTLEGRAPIRLETGDFVLVPVMPAFEMASRPGAACVVGEPSSQPKHYGDPGPSDMRLLGGSFQIDQANAPLLRSLLPEMVFLRAAEIDTGGLSRIVALIVEESADDRPGADMILGRLLEILLIAVLRSDAIEASGARAGLLAGLRDLQLAKALRTMHADIRARWTVAGLAAIAGMSRSAFAARFTQCVGCGPIDYLGHWRMALAKDALGRGGTSLDRLAEEIGYESASAFSTAFRRRVGCAPGSFARSILRPNWGEGG